MSAKTRDDDPEQQRIALMRLGFGRTFPYWAKAIPICATRLATAYDVYPSLRAAVDTVDGQDRHSEWFTSTSLDGHMLIIAVTHVRLLARRAKGLLPSAEVVFAEPQLADAELVRGVLEHFDDYWVARSGSRKRGIQPADVEVSVEYGERDLVFNIGDHVINLLALAASPRCMRSECCAATRSRVVGISSSQLIHRKHSVIP